MKLNQVDIARLRAELQILYTKMQNLSLTMYSELDNESMENIHASVYEIQSELGEWITTYYDMFLDKVGKEIRP